MEFIQGRERRKEGEEEEERQIMIDEMGKHSFQFSPFLSSSPSSSQYEGIFGRRGNKWEEGELYNRTLLNLPSHQGVTNSNHLGQFSRNQNDNRGGESSSGVLEREHMFDKVVTPSDVGKLNRLVIPKQYAEKYFPLDSSANEKGLLLNFEDLTGKLWRFRYSYWNSSQSYVMTKGWSRFVKEKKLDAGDTISFERGAAESAKDRLYIDWRRRANAPPLVHLPHPLSLHRSVPWSRFFFPPTVSMSVPPSQIHLHQLNYGHWSYGGTTYGCNVPNSGSISGGVQQQGGDGYAGVPMEFDSMPAVQSKAMAAKRLRLFGVNLECPTKEDADDQTDFSSLPTLQLRLPNGGPTSTAQENMSKKGKQCLSLDLCE